MAKHALTLVLLACTLIASSCSSVPPSQGGPTQTPTPTLPPPPASSQSVAPRSTPSTPSRTASPVNSSPTTSYDLSVDFDYPAHHLKVQEKITYPNLAQTALSDLLLLVIPNLRDAFVLDDLRWADGSAVTGASLDKQRLTVPLRDPLRTGQTIILNLAYELNLPQIPPPSQQTKPLPFGYSDRQTNLSDWYPFVAPYRNGTGWVAHDPWAFGEFLLYDPADFQVSIRLLNAPGSLVLAASSPATQENTAFSFSAHNARNFVWSASPYYQVQEQQVGDVRVLSYFFPLDAEAGKRAGKDAAAALALYSRIFVPYPHETLSVVEADFLDGMEYDGLFFLSKGFYNLYDGSPNGYLTAISAHETAHQWWYALVGNDQDLEPWLDEGLATYCEALFYENVYPQSLDWWWRTRVSYYQPSGPINLAVPAYPGYEAYRNAVYLRSAEFLRDLRQQIGDPAFFSFLHDLSAQMAGKQDTTQAFFEVLARHSSRDVSALKAEYFQATPAP